MANTIWPLSGLIMADYMQIKYYHWTSNKLIIKYELLFINNLYVHAVNYLGLSVILNNTFDSV